MRPFLVGGWNDHPNLWRIYREYMKNIWNDIIYIYKYIIYIYIHYAGWCFGTLFIFPYVGNNHPNRLIYVSGGLKLPTILLLHEMWQLQGAWSPNSGWRRPFQYHLICSTVIDPPIAVDYHCLPHYEEVSRISVQSPFTLLVLYTCYYATHCTCRDIQLYKHYYSL